MRKWQDEENITDKHQIDELDQECSWCHEKHEESELEETSIGKLCDICKRGIESRGEKI